MKITDRMCNVKWWAPNPTHQDPGNHLGVFKEHTQPVTDGDYTMAGYFDLSISYCDFYTAFRSYGDQLSTIAQDFVHCIGETVSVQYLVNVERDHDYNDRVCKAFVVRAVTLARNYRTHEVDHVVLTLEAKNAITGQGSDYELGY